jgi:hypothetical protein
MSRLTVDLTDQQHQTLKALAALQRRTIKEYVLEKLFPGDANGDDAWQELKILLDARINDGLSGRVSTKSVGEILDEELAETGPA